MAKPVAPVAPIPKKPYLSPKLTIYGTVRELTLHIGSRGNKDNGGLRNSTKTGV
jgi:hypothetical protein